MTQHILILSNFLQKPISEATYAVVSFFEKLVEKQHQRRMYYKTIRELSAMTDRDLNDIGINRYDIPFIARGEYH